MNRYLTPKEIALLAGFLGMLAIGALTQSCKSQWFPLKEAPMAVSTNNIVEAVR